MRISGVCVTTGSDQLRVRTVWPKRMRKIKQREAQQTRAKQAEHRQL